uniref:Uncharacterized protein n=1 Tax=Cacopsylla melanoneura TaxID=428564 RepID=A0A8D9EBC0_9HEMI
MVSKIVILIGIIHFDKFEKLRGISIKVFGRSYRPTRKTKRVIREGRPDTKLTAFWKQTLPFERLAAEQEEEERLAAETLEQERMEERLAAESMDSGLSRDKNKKYSRCNRS